MIFPNGRTYRKNKMGPKNPPETNDELVAASCCGTGQLGGDDGKMDEEQFKDTKDLRLWRRTGSFQQQYLHEHPAT